jgi:hypothetical protein
MEGKAETIGSEIPEKLEKKHQAILRQKGHNH